MKRIACPLLLLHSDRVFRERVRAASKGHYELQEVSSWEQLRDRVREAPPSALVVVDPYEGDYGSESLSPTLHGLLREFPSITILAACEARRGSFEDLRMMGEWGVTRVICLDEEDTPVAITRHLRSAQGRPLRSLLLRSLPPQTSGTARAILIAAADVVSVGGTAKDLARSFHITTRTLLRWAKSAGLPPPQQLLPWMRMLLAAELLDDPGRTVLGVAYACGYSSDSPLRNTMRAYIGVTPKVLRRGDAFATATDAFLSALNEARVKK
ncbi:MAG TPA: helix-turn-helix domain-containing protein [Longimicrobiaceae bacterium]|nr:helix-turn-helix domain-containing protein [Longimicrobiaceae bacterium]